MIRVTQYFSAGYYSWTESWWLSSTSFNDAAITAAQMTSFRVALLGFGASCDQVRLTTDLGTRQVFYLGNGTFPHISRFDNSLPGLSTSDEPYSSVLVRFADSSGYEKLTYLSGFPDGVVTVGDQVPATHNIGPGWLLLFQQWVATLKTVGAKWRSRTRQQVVGGTAAIIGVVVNSLPPGEVGILVANNFAGQNVGDEFQIKGATRILGKNVRQFNGEWFVSSISNVTTPTPGIVYYLRNSQSVDISQLEVFGTASVVDFEYRTVNTGVTDGATHRKRGVRTARPLGRSKTRS